MTRENFINDIAAAAKELGKKNNILPSLIMGVACHESNFGNSELAEKGNNLFGVKGTYEGQSVLLPTWEVIDGVRHDIQAAFRKYPSYRESIQDFCNLLVNGVSWNREIYHSVLGVTDWEAVIDAFSKTPYMTDPAYFGKLRNITDTYKLYEYNEEEPKENEAIPAAPEEEQAPTEAAPEAGEAPEAPEATPDPAQTVGEEIVTETPEEPAAPEAVEPEAPAAPEAPPEEEKGEVYIEFPNMLFKIGSKRELCQNDTRTHRTRVKSRWELWKYHRCLCYGVSIEKSFSTRWDCRGSHMARII